MIYELINNLPTNAKTSVLYGLVGSLNASVLYAAQQIVKQCDASGDDVHEELCMNFPKTSHEAAMAAELGNQVNRWEDLKAQITLRRELHDMLMVERNTTEEVLPLHNTLKFLTTSVKELPREQLDELIKMLNIKGLTADSIRTMHKVDADMKRAELAAMSERVLSVALALPELDDAEPESAFRMMSGAKRLSMWSKVDAALNKARNNIIVGMLQRRNVDIGDIPLITHAIDEVQTMMRNTTEGEASASGGYKVSDTDLHKTLVQKQTDQAEATYVIETKKTKVRPATKDKLVNA